MVSVIDCKWLGHWATLSTKGVILGDTCTDIQMLITLAPANYGTSRVKVDG